MFSGKCYPKFQLSLGNQYFYPEVDFDQNLENWFLFRRVPIAPGDNGEISRIAILIDLMIIEG